MTSPDPLVGIDTVPWNTLSHAYGPADDVPGLLKDLLSTDKGKVQKTIWTLFGNIYHQGTRYSASAAAVPFLFSILNTKSSLCRKELLELLVHLAAGMPLWPIPNGLDINQWRASVEEELDLEESDEQKEEQEVCASEPDDEDEEVEDDSEMEMASAIFELQTYDAVQREIGSIIACLGDEDAAIRAWAAMALAYFPEQRARIEPTLLDFIYNEKDVAAQATGLIAVALVNAPFKREDTNTAAEKKLREVFAKDITKDITRWSSAVGLVILGRQRFQHLNEVARKVNDNSYLEAWEPSELRDSGTAFPFGLDGLQTLADEVIESVKGIASPDVLEIIQTGS